MNINQAGQPIFERQLFAFAQHYPQASDDERDNAIALILQHLGLEIVATNATKHGNTEMVLRPNHERPPCW